MRRLFGLLTAAVLILTAPLASAADEPPTDGMLTGSGLVCDTKEQAERFISLMDRDVETTLLAVNSEAGDDHACVVTTFGFIPGAKVSDVDKNGTVVHVLEVKVMAVATIIGLQLIEPKTFYTVVPSKQRNV